MIEMLIGGESKATPGEVVHSGEGSWSFDVPRGYKTLDVILIGAGSDGSSSYGGGGGAFLYVDELFVDSTSLELVINSSGTHVFDENGDVLVSVSCASSQDGASTCQVNSDGNAVFYSGGSGGGYSSGYGGGGGSAGRYDRAGGEGAKYSTYTQTTTSTRAAWDSIDYTQDANAYDWDIRINQFDFDNSYKNNPSGSRSGFIIAARNTDAFNGKTYYRYYKRVSETYTTRSTKYKIASGTPSGSAGQGQGGGTNEDGEGAGLTLTSDTPSNNGYGYGGGRNRSGGEGALKIQWGYK